MQKYKFIIFLCLIAVLAGFLRFWQLGINPPSLSWDEVAWGYNAYSLSKDGRDEFGRFLPMDYLESYGDFKPPVYAYLDIIPVKLFGLNGFSARLPSAFFGTLSIVVTYFLVKRIFYKSENKKWYAIATSLVLAVSPWQIMLSRAAFEANVASFFVITGIWGFLSALQERKWYFWVISSICFSLSMATFNSARVVTPILCLVLAIFFWKNLLLQKKIVILSLIIGIVILFPTLKFLLSPQAKLRYQEVNIFSDVTLVKNANQQIANDGNTTLSKILHNRRLVYAVSYLQHYFDNLSPQFLFYTGDGNPKFSTRDVGQMYLWDLPFFAIGILLLFRKKEGYWYLIPLWLIIGIIPAGVARETPHALRIENTLPTFQIFTAIGFVSSVLFLKKYRKVFIPVTLLLLLTFVGYFLHGYYYHYPKEFSSDWQYGYSQILSFAKQNENSYQNVMVTRSFGRPYMYYLFFNRVNPKYFRDKSKITRDAFGFVHVEKIDKYLFPDFLTKMSNTLYLADPTEVPTNARVLTTVNFINGDKAFVAYTL